jgi:hypothetical protein
MLLQRLTVVGSVKGRQGRSGTWRDITPTRSVVSVCVYLGSLTPVEGMFAYNCQATDGV